MVISLGCPDERLAERQPDAIQAWVAAWQIWQGVGALEWQDRQWRTLGVQRLPRRLTLANPDEVAAWLDETAHWQRARARHGRLAALWPSIATQLRAHFDVLAGYGEDDFRRLESMLGWLEANPRSNLYPRQLPVSGLDTKWLESRRPLLTSLVAVLHGGNADDADFYQCCGLRQMPNLVRLRLLDPYHRKIVGGLGDISAPIAEVAALHIPVKSLYIVENLQTGLAFDDLPDTAVIMGLGYGVDVLGQLPWLAAAHCFYWGDLDTHGFAILNRARSYLPNLRSLLMDKTTLLNHKALWVQEEQQHSSTELPFLTRDESEVYQILKEQRWGINIRLEQERIPWTEAWDKAKPAVLTEG
jgi:hypothetical protein